MKSPDFKLCTCRSCGLIHRAWKLANPVVTEMKRWSDGKVVSPEMEVCVPPLVQCSGCGKAMLTIDDYTPIDQYTNERTTELVYDEFAVRLVDIGVSRAKLVSAIRSQLSVPIAELVQRIAKLPAVLLTTTDQEQALALLTAIKQAGGRAVLEGDDNPLSTEVDNDVEPWRSAPGVRLFDEEQLLQIIESGDCPKLKRNEKLYRVQAWWRGNDPFRRQFDWVPHQQRTQASQHNLQRLLVMLDQPLTPDTWLMKAEAARQLELFDQCLEALSRVKEGEAGFFSSQLETVARAGNSAVFPLQSYVYHVRNINEQPFPDKPELLVDVIQTMLPQPVYRKTIGRTVYLRGGYPSLVVVTVSTVDVSVFSCGYTWTGPHHAVDNNTRIAHWTIPELVELATAWQSYVANAIDRAALIRQAAFRNCRICHVATPPEWGDYVCGLCAEHYLGIVH